MEPQLENERSTLRTNLITIDRPDSSQLVDLHVFIIPKTSWNDQKNLAENDAIEQAISAGFVRVPQNLTIHDLRQHIFDVCGQEDDFPKEFIYLRSVGRCLAKVKPPQETELRVKNYRPPITFAPEIYILEGHFDDDLSMTSKSKSYLSRESPIEHLSATPPQATISRQQSWMKAIPESPPSSATVHRPFADFNEQPSSRNLSHSALSSSSSNLSRASSTLSARELGKLREEQERLRLRQIELARQRREIEEEQKRRGSHSEEHSPEKKTEEPKREVKHEDQKPGIAKHDEQNRKVEPEQHKHELDHIIKKPEIKHEEKKPKSEHEEQKHQTEQGQQQQKRETELLTKPKNPSQTQEEAAVRIQATYRGYQSRRKTKEQKQRELDAHEIERLQKEARELSRRKAEEEHSEQIKAHDVKLFSRLEEMKRKRVELETNREGIIRRIQQLHAQIAVRRTEERDLWKQKYLNEKKKTVELEEKTRTTPKDESDISSQLEQAKIRLNNSTKLRQQAENECQLLQQELQQMRISMNALEKHSLPKQLPATQQQQQEEKIPISFDITLKSSLYLT